MPDIDSKGVFRLEVLEAAVSTTAKGYPQWVARLKAVEKYIEDPADIAHFQGQGLLQDGQPGYVDWAPFGEEIIGYLVMFNSADSLVTEGPGKTSLMNYEQMQLALGWDGTEFDSLADGTHVGKVIMGRIEESEYQGKTSLKLNWVDHRDASPTRTLKNLDTDTLKSLTAKLKLGAPKKAVAPAKPAVAKPGTPVKPGAAATPTKAVTPAAPVAAPAPAKPLVKLPAAQTPASSAAAPTTSPAVPKSPSKAPVSLPPTAPVEEPTGLPAECDQMAAWESVQAMKGTNEDNVIQEAWMAACAEVGGERDEAQFTASDWAKIRDVVIRDCALAA